MQIHVHAYILVHTCTCIYLCMYIHVHVYACIYLLHTYTCTCTYMYIHAYSMYSTCTFIPTFIPVHSLVSISFLSARQVSLRISRIGFPLLGGDGCHGDSCHGDGYHRNGCHGDGGTHTCDGGTHACDGGTNARVRFFRRTGTAVSLKLVFGVLTLYHVLPVSPKRLFPPGEDVGGAALIETYRGWQVTIVCVLVHVTQFFLVHIYTCW